MKKIFKTLAASLVGVVIFTGVASAAPFSNGGFESAVLPAVPFATYSVGNPSLAPWTIPSGSVDHIRTYWSPSEGLQSLDMTGYSAGEIMQTFDTIPGAEYMISFDLSGNPAGYPFMKELRVRATGNPAEDYSYDVTGNTLLNMNWEKEHYTFVAPDVTTSLLFTSLITGFYGPALDNVMIESVSPTHMDMCKKGGWELFHHPTFKNQGDCVSYVQSSEHAVGN